MRIVFIKTTTVSWRKYLISRTHSWRISSFYKKKLEKSTAAVSSTDRSILDFTICVTTVRAFSITSSPAIDYIHILADDSPRRAARVDETVILTGSISNWFRPVVVAFRVTVSETADRTWGPGYRQDTTVESWFVAVHKILFHAWKGIRIERGGRYRGWPNSGERLCELLRKRPKQTKMTRFFAAALAHFFFFLDS